MKKYFLNGKLLNLNQNNFVGSGGQANVYKIGRSGIKIYHDYNDALPEKKIIELSKIKANNVIIPRNIIYDSNNRNVGYEMRFLENTHPLCKLFVNNFKIKNNISHKIIVEFIKYIQKTIHLIHNCDICIVDFNELNVLSCSKFKIPYFIDVDSYKTKSFPATVIMESIKDPLVKNNNFDELSDWFSFAIIIFQLYIGVHPYKGKHPNYKQNEWQKRMKNGISVFDKNVKIPNMCNDFNVIPRRHLDWLKLLFIKNERSIPPQIDISIPIVTPEKIILIKNTDNFNISSFIELNKGETIKKIYDIVGIKYYITHNSIYKNSTKIIDDIRYYDKVLATYTNKMEVVICKYKSNLITFEHNKQKIDERLVSDVLVKDNKIFVIINNKLFKIQFNNINGKIVKIMKSVANVLELSSKMFDGVIYQNLLNTCHLTLIYEEFCITKHIKELDRYRILDMKMEKHICIVNAEKKSKYYRFILIFDFSNPSNITYKLRKIDDVQYDSINFTVKNDVCIYLTDENKIEIFIDHQKRKIIENSPIDSSMTLFNLSNKIYFVDRNVVYNISMK